MVTLMKLTPFICKSTELMCYAFLVTSTFCRDCIRFSFMDLLQGELNDICEMWNTHLIRADRTRRHVSGIPDELFFIPEIRGIIHDIVFNLPCYFLILLIGFQNHICAVDALDIAFCKPYTNTKPLPAPSEFHELADILMRENGWSLPSTCEDALKLYIDLVNCIH